jgi:hypothetical protein
MARSIYVMPIVTRVGPKYAVREPKYISLWEPTNGGKWTSFDYGDEPWCLVGITDIPPAVETNLLANADVSTLPSDLDQTLGTTTARNTVANRLEAVNMPGTWVVVGNTYREVVRFIGGVCQFAQRFQGISGIPANRWFTGGRTLDSTFSSLPVAARNSLTATAVSFGFSTAGITGASIMRDILKTAADQYVAQYVANNPAFGLNLEGPL